MHELFPAFYDLSDDEIARLWQEGIFIFDTNMLLNVYRYNDETRDRFFEILDRLKNRIWIPFQVALEYQDSRIEVIEEQVKAYSIVSDAFKKAIEILDGLNHLKKKHSFISVEELTEAPRKALRSANDQLTQELNKHKREYEKLKVSDPHRERITELFQGKIGSAYDREKMLELYQEADKRSELSIPPGYKDKRKKKYNKYGDIIIWFQLIDYARSQNKPIIFVTDDEKSDWYISREESKTKTIRPRTELVQEMLREANVLIHMYQGYEFIDEATKFLTLQQKPEIIEDAREVSESNTSRGLQLFMHHMFIDQAAKPFTLYQKPEIVEDAREVSESNVSRAFRRYLQEQKRKAKFELSVLSLKEMLDRYGIAETDADAWGYSPFPKAKRLDNGTIEVTTYHYESEWKTKILDNETEVIDYLYDDGDAYWYPEEWHEPR